MPPPLILRFFPTPKRNKITTLCSNAIYLPKNNNTFVFNNKSIYKEKHYNCSYFILCRAVKCSFFESQTLLFIIVLVPHNKYPYGIYTQIYNFLTNSITKKSNKYVLVYIESTFRIFTVSFPNGIKEEKCIF